MQAIQQRHVGACIKASYPGMGLTVLGAKHAQLYLLHCHRCPLFHEEHTRCVKDLRSTWQRAAI